MLSDADGLEWPSHPTPLGAFIQYLEGNGKVRIDFKNYEYRKDHEDPSKYIITCKDDIMVNVVPIEGLALVWHSKPV